MKLEPIIQSEVSQKEKHQYNILVHIYGIQKDGNDNTVCETAKETQIEQSFGLCGRGGVGGDCDQPGARAGRGARVSRERKSGSPGRVCVSERLDWRD